MWEIAFNFTSEKVSVKERWRKIDVMYESIYE
jgi:hypothetical protein